MRIKNKLLTSTFALIAWAGVSSAALAQKANTTLVNTGSINNTLSTVANSAGTGTSYSAANGAASALSTGSSVSGPYAGGYYGNTTSLTGNTATSNQGQAYNYSTGGGSGTASSDGNSNAALSTTANYAGSGDLGNGYTTTQTLGLAGSIASDDSIAINNVGTNGGGAANAGTTSSFSAAGDVAASGNSTSNYVTGSVTDTKATDSTASTSNIINLDNNGTNVVLTDNNTPTDTAQTNVSVSGSFEDPTATK